MSQIIQIKPVIQEIKLEWDKDIFSGDLTYDRGDLKYDQGIGTATLISLFTDRRALDDDVLPDPNSNDKRGWWADLVNPEVEDDQIGSKLWLLERSKTTPDILVRAKQYSEESLSWFVEDGIASNVSVEVERQGDPGNDRLALGILLTLIDGTPISIGINKELSAELQKKYDYLYMLYGGISLGDDYLFF